MGPPEGNGRQVLSKLDGLVELSTSPARPESHFLPRLTPGPIVDDLERQYGPNPIERSFGESPWVHRKATGDKCSCIWTDLSSYQLLFSFITSLQRGQPISLSCFIAKGLRRHAYGNNCIFVCNRDLKFTASGISTPESQIDHVVSLLGDGFKRHRK